MKVPTLDAEEFGRWLRRKISERVKYVGQPHNPNGCPLALFAAEQGAPTRFYVGGMRPGEGPAYSNEETTSIPKWCDDFQNNAIKDDLPTTGYITPRKALAALNEALA